ncbi:MAG: hypothetical protein GYB67_01965 [Chloroflexi bacterium]|nr:hypothetical protein [Chloroflexota bacterium]
MIKLRTVTINRIIALLLAGAMLIPVMSAAAQDSLQPHSLTLSEAEINEALRAGSQDPNSSLTIDFQPGQMVINLDVTGQRGNTTRFGLTVVPAVENGQLRLNPTRLTINTLEINLNNNNNRAVTNATGTVEGYLAQQTGGGQVESVSITDDQMTLAWVNSNPDDPIIAIRDSRFSLTYTEAAINRMGWVTNPGDPNTTAINVDLQPGQAVVHTTRSAAPASVSYSIIPTMVNGRVTWRVSASADAGGSAANTLATIWGAYFNALYNDGGLTEAVITDNTITFTWDLTAPNAQPGNAVVTYTVDEGEVNGALAAFETEDVTDLSVDMQPGRITLNAAGVNAAGTPYTAAVSLRPVLTNGRLTWTAESVTFNGLVLDAAALQAGNQAAAALVGGLDGNQRGATITDVQITDSTLSVTVRYR